MKYRTKLILAFSGIVVATVLLVEGLSYHETKKVFIGEMRSKVLGAAITTSKLLNPRQIELAQQEMSDKTNNFTSLVQQLRMVRDANRRTDFYVLYIYLVEPNPKSPQQLIVVADATEDPSFYVPPGTVYPEGKKIGILDHLNTPYAPRHQVEDRWGKFLPAYAPIFNDEGKYLATLGMNLSAEYVDQELMHLRWIALVSMTLSLAAGLIIAALLAHGITKSLDQICLGISLIGQGDLETKIKVRTKDEFEHLALAINEMTSGLQERERLKSNFIRYVSKHVMENILKADKLPALEGERRKITVMFSDIRDFTRLAEKMGPEEVVSLLNEYLRAMLDVIFFYDGTLDKFIGDGLMIEFGAPLEDTEQENHAVQTAIAMHRALQLLNQKWSRQGRPEISMGIGIHTGFAIVGNIGSERRMEYTAIGDTVNIASRLQEATKELKIPILISANTWKGTRDRFHGRELGLLQLKGRAEPINVFAIELSQKA